MVGDEGRRAGVAEQLQQPGHAFDQFALGGEVCVEHFGALADLHLELLLLELQRRQETLELLLRVLLLFQLGFGELDLSHAASPSVQFFFGQY